MDAGGDRADRRVDAERVDAARRDRHAEPRSQRDGRRHREDRRQARRLPRQRRCCAHSFTVREGETASASPRQGELVADRAPRLRVGTPSRRSVRSSTPASICRRRRAQPARPLHARRRGRQLGRERLHRVRWLRHRRLAAVVRRALARVRAAPRQAPARVARAARAALAGQRRDDVARRARQPRPRLHVDSTSGQRQYKDQPGSGQHFWQELAISPAVVVSDLRAQRRHGAAPGRHARPAVDSRSSAAGASATSSSAATRRCAASTARRCSPTEHIGPEFQLEEGTLEEDAYQASLDTYAGYAIGGGRDRREAPRESAARGSSAPTQEMTNGSRYAIAGLETEVIRDRQRRAAGREPRVRRAPT